MRRDELDFTSCQPRLLVDDVIDEFVRSNDTRICRLPSVSNPPITYENQHRADPFFNFAILPDHPAHLGGVRYCLIKTILFLRSSIDKQTFAIAKCDLASSATKFRFNGIDAGGPDHNMVDIESVAGQVMSHTVSVVPQIIQNLGHSHFPVFTTIEATKLGNQTTKAKPGESGHNDGYDQPKQRDRWCSSPCVGRFNDPNEPKEKRNPDVRREAVFQQTIFLVAERLSGQATYFRQRISFLFSREHAPQVLLNPCHRTLHRTTYDLSRITRFAKTTVSSYVPLELAAKLSP